MIPEAWLNESVSYKTARLIGCHVVRSRTFRTTECCIQTFLRYARPAIRHSASRRIYDIIRRVMIKRARAALLTSAAVVIACSALFHGIRSWHNWAPAVIFLTACAELIPAFSRLFSRMASFYKNSLLARILNIKV